MPNSPTTAEEVRAAFENSGVQELYSKTKHVDSEYYFYKDSYACDNFAYSYFASDHVIANIVANIPVGDREFLMDATFKITPLGSFYQLLIIYVGYCGQVKGF